MKIMLDTNVLISAFVFGGKAGKLMMQLIDSEHELYVSELRTISGTFACATPRMISSG